MIVISAMEGPPLAERGIEIVERKGLGHPDTMCDLLSERLSVALSRYYIEHFGLILHHNVDKCLLAAGTSRPRFGGGDLVAPIELHFAGRATLDVKGAKVPIDELLHECVVGFVAETFRALDAERHLRIHNHIHPGSGDLVELFMRQQQTGVLFANDTSCGSGCAPMSQLERTVLNVEKRLNDPGFKEQVPAAGEDIKVMGVRQERAVRLTVSCAFIDRWLLSLADYADAREAVAAEALSAARAVCDGPLEIEVNSADDLATGCIYLTVTGTSAECGDDGMTGRGNRANGLITPMRPMTMEAVAGKNPVTHVGKIYNVGAQLIAERVVEAFPEVTEAECLLVSRIGRPITEPQICEIRARNGEGVVSAILAERIRELVTSEINALPRLAAGFAAGELPIA